MNLPLPFPDAGEELLHLVHGPTGAPTICGACREDIVRMPAGHYRSTSSDHTRDRLVCGEAKDGTHRPADVSGIEVPIQAGDLTALGLPQESGGAG